ncbi:MAG: ABC transporter ATP-binding protein [Blastocatellia bacterium]|nr:ABC transporter ATP-binding protein [Blastocatellia bacterium]
MNQPVPPIFVRNLTKSFGPHVAVNNLSLEINQGEIFGFLGPNGAGKTTTIHMLMGFIRPTGGTCRICGLNCHADDENEVLGIRRKVGFVPDVVTFPDFLTGYELLEQAGHLHGLSRHNLRERIFGLLQEHDLTAAADQYPANYSLGMRRKLALAHAQIHNPEVFILDEPTNGLDPNAARDIKQWMVRTAAAGKTIFLSTHLLDMAERYCGRVGVIAKGTLQTVSAPADLKQTLQKESLEEVFFKITEGAEE